MHGCALYSRIESPGIFNTIQENLVIFMCVKCRLVLVFVVTVTVVAEQGHKVFHPETHVLQLVSRKRSVGESSLLLLELKGIHLQEGVGQIECALAHLEDAFFYGVGDGQLEDVHIFGLTKTMGTVEGLIF